MNKARLEGLSDATFAIVFTLLVIEIRVPEHLSTFTSGDLWHALVELAPLFEGYIVSFLVLTMFWISHNFFYGMLIKNINRTLAALNMLYLALVALIPFSAHLLGRYSELQLAVSLYGLNVFAIGILVALIFEYALRAKEIDTDHNSSRLIKQARIRIVLTPFFTLLGIASALSGFLALALILYIFPVIFNIIPGTLDKVEKLFRIRFE